VDTDQFQPAQALTFYPERPQAIAAARKKFVICRVGDACMLGVLVLTYLEFGSWELRSIRSCPTVAHDRSRHSPAVTGIGFWLVLGAC
jgi:NAD(P)H-quinone oxidoreductase subunit 5